MVEYKIQRSKDLTTEDIKTILNSWSILEWKQLTAAEFVEKFSKSEFYLLSDNNQLVSLLRVNYDFAFRIGEIQYFVPELVGLVSIIQGKGYGKQLLEKLKENLISRNIECIGFCFAHNRGFYEKCGIEIFEDMAKLFMEREGDNWVSSEDDDVLNINLTEKTRNIIKSIFDENRAYLLASEEMTQVCEIPN